MSSVLRASSQIPIRSKFLIAIASSVSGNAAADSSVISQEWLGSVVMAADVNAGASTQSFSAGALFRDLGRQMMVVDEIGAHVALYREAMSQANAGAEGIATIGGSVWLRVWAADGAAVRVARLG